MKTMQVFLVIVIGSAIAAIIIYCAVVRPYFYYFDETDLADNLHLSSEWMTIPLDSLEIKRKEYYFLGIVVKEPYGGGLSDKGIRTPTGSIVNPQIRLIDDQNVSYDFILCRSSSYGNNARIIGYCYKDKELPKDRIYRTLAIRSEEPVLAAKVLWSGYDADDLK